MPIQAKLPKMSPLITTLVLATFISSLKISAQSTTLFSPITKDETTNLYTMLIYMKTPLQPSMLHLDIGSFLPWYDCNRHYKSSSYAPVIYNTTLCLDLDTKGWVNCFDKPGPGCSNETCSFMPQNPVTLKSGVGSIITDKFALPTVQYSVQLGSTMQMVLSCTFPNKYSRIYRGLAKGSTGLASLGRFNYSLSAQISRGSSSPWIFAVCLPSSSKSTGIVVFNTGPYNFSPKIEVSKLLSYTPLILAPKGSDTDTMNWYKSPEYYIGLSSFRVNGKIVNLNQTLLAIDDLGLGGTKISSSKPYSVLQSSIYKALVDAFVEESISLNLTASAAVKPFRVCFEADKVQTTMVGPVVPAIDLVFPRSKNFWRIYGSNLMVRVENVWCLGFVDGGMNPRTSIVIGGHQIEDNLLQFDLERERLGFSSSLLLQSSTCADFKFQT